jgi:hypothetical protein
MDQVGVIVQVLELVGVGVTVGVALAIGELLHVGVAVGVGLLEKVGVAVADEPSSSRAQANWVGPLSVVQFTESLVELVEPGQRSANPYIWIRLLKLKEPTVVSVEPLGVWVKPEAVAEDSAMSWKKTMVLVLDVGV